MRTMFLRYFRRIPHQRTRSHPRNHRRSRVSQRHSSREVIIALGNGRFTIDHFFYRSRTKSLAALTLLHAALAPPSRRSTASRRPRAAPRPHAAPAPHVRRPILPLPTILGGRGVAAGPGGPGWGWSGGPGGAGRGWGGGQGGAGWGQGRWGGGPGGAGWDAPAESFLVAKVSIGGRRCCGDIDRVVT